jgi:hypothetical protein
MYRPVEACVHPPGPLSNECLSCRCQNHYSVSSHPAVCRHLFYYYHVPSKSKPVTVRHFDCTIRPPTRQPILPPSALPIENRRRQPRVPRGYRLSVLGRYSGYRRRCRQVPTGTRRCQHVPTGVVGAAGCAARYPPCRAALSVPNLQFRDIPKLPPTLLRWRGSRFTRTYLTAGEQPRRGM